MSLTLLTTTDIADGINLNYVYANKPTEKPTAYVYMTSIEWATVPSFVWYIDRVLNVSFYFIASETPAADKTAEEEIDIMISTMTNLLVKNTEQTFNGKKVYKVEQWQASQVFYTDKDKPLKIVNYLFYYRAYNG